jgi:hypothetical protein
MFEEIMVEVFQENFNFEENLTKKNLFIFLKNV